eukprot:1142727-Pelagomonas_calceolata.AAC.1
MRKDFRRGLRIGCRSCGCASSLLLSLSMSTSKKVPTVHNRLQCLPDHDNTFNQNETCSTTAQLPSSIKSTQCALKCPPANNVPSVGSQLVPIAFFQEVNVPPYQTW